MRIIADEKIPFLQEFFGDWGELITPSGQKINRKNLNHATCLLTRSITTVNEQLLRNNNVRFVASATAGIDHLDIDYLNKKGIAWAYAPGCNATAVAEYVIACVAWLQINQFLPAKHFSAGVIGVGNVGTQVVSKLKIIGAEVKVNDPPLGLNDQMADLDLICVHTPLTRSGPHPTFHLLSEHFLAQQKKNCVILNAGRGEVLEETCLSSFPHLQCVLDVWENEPDINPETLQRALLATPHIAGYSQLAKWRATQMIHDQAARFFSKPARAFKPTLPEVVIDNQPEDKWQDIILKILDPKTLSLDMKNQLQQSHDCFEQLRRNYPLRPEFEQARLAQKPLSVKTEQILTLLGIKPSL